MHSAKSITVKKVRDSAWKISSQPRRKHTLRYAAFRLLFIVHCLFCEQYRTGPIRKNIAKSRSSHVQSLQLEGLPAIGYSSAIILCNPCGVAKLQIARRSCERVSFGGVQEDSVLRAPRKSRIWHVPNAYRQFVHHRQQLILISKKDMLFKEPCRSLLRNSYRHYYRPLASRSTRNQSTASDMHKTVLQARHMHTRANITRVRRTMIAPSNRHLCWIVAASGTAYSRSRFLF